MKNRLSIGVVLTTINGLEINGQLKLVRPLGEDKTIFKAILTL